MIRVRRASERGHFNHGWLDTSHTFSFSRYYDPNFMGFRSLRVINEDRVQPGRGFGQHGHDNMEIVTIVLEGALEHRDSLGSGEVLRPGEVQAMSAGTGIVHSEFNPSPTEGVHFYQIWIEPDRAGHAPRYGQRKFAESDRRGKWQLVASPDGRDGSLPIHQDARILRTELQPGESITHASNPGRHAWVQVLRGSVVLNGQTLQAGDGAAISEEAAVTLTGASETGDVLVFDLGS